MVPDWLVGIGVLRQLGMGLATRRSGGWVEAASADDLDNDILALELFELIERRVVGSEMDRLV